MKHPISVTIFYLLLVFFSDQVTFSWLWLLAAFIGDILTMVAWNKEFVRRLGPEYQ